MRPVVAWLLSRDTAGSVAGYESESMFDAAAGVRHGSVATGYANGALVLLHTSGAPVIHNPTVQPIDVAFWSHTRDDGANLSAYVRVVPKGAPPVTTLRPGAQVAIPYGATLVSERLHTPGRHVDAVGTYYRNATALRILRSS